MYNVYDCLYNFRNLEITSLVKIRLLWLIYHRDIVLDMMVTTHVPELWTFPDVLHKIWMTILNKLLYYNPLKMSFVIFFIWGKKYFWTVRKTWYYEALYKPHLVIDNENNEYKTTDELCEAEWMRC